MTETHIVRVRIPRGGEDAATLAEIDATNAAAWADARQWMHTHPEVEARYEHFLGELARVFARAALDDLLAEKHATE